MLTLAIALLAQAGDTVRLVERPCAACVISIDTATVLGDADGPGLLRGPQVAVARDVQGRYLVGGATSAGSISVFDSAGRFVRSVGRPGGGPGEYRRIWRISPFSQGVVVTDDFAARHTILSADFDVVRSIPATGGVPLSLVAGAGGRLLESATVRRSGDAGYALFFRDSVGAIRGRASGVRRRLRDDDHDPAWRTLSVSADGGEAWVAHRDSYLIERCSFRTEACVVIKRSVDWFPARRELAPSFDERMSRFPPSPQLLGVSPDGRRYLWVLSLVADEQWPEGLVLGGVHPGVRDQHRYWDTVIELVDLETLSVIATRRIDGALYPGPLAGGRAFVYREDADGVPRVDILRFTLRQLPR